MKRNKSFTKIPFYFVATPIGNLSEFSNRAIDILNNVDFIACEDTRVTGVLLSYYKISKPLISLFEHNEKEKALEIIKQIQKGQTGAYVSDAGYPLISDPGAILVNELLSNDIYISVINGPSALLPALIGSGISTSSFYFRGFLPPKLNLSFDEESCLRTRKETLIFYESPHRIKKTMSYLYDILGDRKVTLARELTKINEEYLYGTLKEFLTFDYKTIKGEIVIVVEGSTISNEDIIFENSKKQVSLLLEENYALKEACKIVSLLNNISKNALYRAFLTDK